MPRAPRTRTWAAGNRQGQGKFYAVFKGRNTGIFNNYPECEQQVRGFSGAIHKSFKTQALAEAWLRELLDAEIETENIRISQLNSNINERSDDALDPSEIQSEPLKDHQKQATIEPPSPPLSPGQNHVLDLVLEGRNVFFTGPAGSGKSLIIKHIKYQLELSGKKCYVTAPTGAAAVLIDGHTIHSWSGVGKGGKGILEYLHEVGTKSAGFWKDVQVLIVDEVSMLLPDLLEKLDRIAKAWRYPRDEWDDTPAPPFGGIQLVFCGDFYQLPPVDPESDKNCYKCGLPVVPSFTRVYLAKNHPRIRKEIAFLDHIHSMGVNPSRWTVCNRFLPSKRACNHLWNDSLKYSFQTPTWSSLNFHPVLLTDVFRQKDQAWVAILNEIKVGRVDNNTLNFLHSLRRPLPALASGIKPTKLYALRWAVNQENEQEFKKLNRPTYKFRASDKGAIMRGKHEIIRKLTRDELGQHHFFRNHSTPAECHLKEGAQIMLLSNINIEMRLVNGSRGKVSGFKSLTWDEFYEHCKSQKSWQDNNLHDLKNYFSAHAENKSISLPLVEFLPATQLQLICPVFSDSYRPEYFRDADGRLEKNELRVQRIQIPLMLAWASTIHKSQGQSFDYVSVDISHAFTTGQAYVALSRCRSPGGMQIIGDWNLSRAIMADPVVLTFYQMLEKELEKTPIGASPIVGPIVGEVRAGSVG